MRVRSALAAACLLGMTSCVLPARSFGAYEEKAARTAETVLSAVESTRLAVRAAHEGRGLSAYITTLIAESEDEASSAQSTFASIQPPDSESQKLSEALGAIVEPALRALSQLRIDARGGRTDGLPGADASLRRAAAKLRAFLHSHG